MKNVKISGEKWKLKCRKAFHSYLNSQLNLPEGDSILPYNSSSATHLWRFLWNGSTGNRKITNKLIEYILHVLRVKMKGGWGVCVWLV